MTQPHGGVNRWQRAVLSTAGLDARPFTLPCSAPGCVELVRKRARFCATHGRKWEERGHDGREEGERLHRGSGTAAAQRGTRFPGAEAQRGEGASNLCDLTRRNRGAAINTRKGTPLK